MMREEIEPTLRGLGDLDLAAYRARLIDRFANPALAHQTRQIAMDGSQKIPQRLLGTVRDRLTAGEPIARLALAVAAWLHFLRGVDEARRPYEINDPLAAELAALQARAATMPDETQRVATLCGFAPVFGSLGEDRHFIEAVSRHTASLRERGVHATLEALP
jgi:fructuronate reductase